MQPLASWKTSFLLPSVAAAAAVFVISPGRFPVTSSFISSHCAVTFFRDYSERSVKLNFHNPLVCRLGIVKLHVCPFLHVRDLVLSNEHFCHFLLLLRSVYLCVEQNDLLISEVIIGPMWARFSFHSLTG